MHRATRLFLLASTLMLTPLAACGGEQKPLAEKSEELKVEEPKTATAMHYTVDASASDMTFHMDAPIEKMRGVVDKSDISGELNVDTSDLTKSNGIIRVNLKSLAIYQRKAPEKGAEFGEEEKVDLQNEHARAWLEIGEDAPAEDREKNQKVEFSLREIKDASATNIDEMEGDERKVTFTGIGDFRLHQRKKEVSVKLEATFTYADGKPVKVHVKSVEPFGVDLAEHDVRPREAFGKLAQKTLSALSDKVAQVADVSVEFVATVDGEVKDQA